MVHQKLNSKQIIKLYDYQNEALPKLITSLKTTFRALLVFATGLGKTILSIEVVKYFLNPKAKILFLCHDNGILDKAYKDYRAYIKGAYSFTQFYGEGKDWEADKHNFVFATFQSVLDHLQNEDAKKKLFSPDHFSFIVVDESHHSQAKTFAEVLNYFKPKYMFGMTATPDREDGRDIREFFGDAVVDIRLPEAIASGFLADVDYKVLSDGLNEEKIREICKEVLTNNVRLTEKQINDKIFIKVRTEEQCNIIEQYSKTKKAIVFCENIEHLKHVASILPSAVTIHSKQSTRINDHNFSLFENGHVRHVVVVDKFNEGIDIPDTELLVFLRGTNSEWVFFHQLGRGLRKAHGKEKVTVLDFVANIERIREVMELTEKIKQFSDMPLNPKGSFALNSSLYVEGKGFSFNFSNQIVNILSVFERIKKDFYPTWEEASQAVIELGINNWEDYKSMYIKDPRLPSSPGSFYLNYPGARKFFLQKYLTWQEASVAAVKLGIRSSLQYRFKYKKDPMLPGALKKTYKDFPGFEVFFQKKKYKTWQEASAASFNLGIRTYIEYKKTYKMDPRLFYDPEKSYPDFPGWDVFFNRSNVKYLTCQEASVSAILLGCKSKDDYRIKYKQDPRLRNNPARTYSDFPGWKKFLGK